MKICRYCGREFEPIRATQLDCRSKCTQRFNRAKLMEKQGYAVYDRICPDCGRSFKTSNKSRLRCCDCDVPAQAKRRKPKTRKVKNRSLSQINNLARKSGISYGKYVAEQNMKPLERRDRVGLSKV